MWSVLPRSLIEDIFSVFWGEGKVIGQVLTGWMSFAVELAVSEHWWKRWLNSNSFIISLLHFSFTEWIYLLFCHTLGVWSMFLYVYACPLHISITICPNFTQFSVHVTCVNGLVLLWQQCYHVLLVCEWRHVFTLIRHIQADCLNCLVSISSCCNCLFDSFGTVFCFWFVYCLLNYHKLYRMLFVYTHTQPFYCCSGICPGPPGWAGTRKVNQEGYNQSGFTGARDSEWQWHLLGYMQVCTSKTQTTTPTSHHSVFYRPDALPAAQPTASKHCIFGLTGRWHSIDVIWYGNVHNHCWQSGVEGGEGSTHPQTSSHPSYDIAA